MKMPKDKLDEYSNKYNRAKHQCEFLYDLLKGNMDLYVELEDAIKYLNLHYCPGDTTECHFVLAKYRTHKHIDKLFNSLKVNKGSYCRLKGTNIFGIIKNELDGSPGKFPDQWGVYWLSGREGSEYVDELRKYKGHPMYWNDKENIEIISHKKFHEKHWNVRTIFKYYGN